MRVLGIETSCDETGIALYDSERGLLSDALYSQVEIHREYGGVVPELASRDHVRKALPLLQTVLEEGGCDRPDAVTYTAGPGLVGALMVGATLARSLALGWGVPVLGVHHMEGHLLAPMLEEQQPQYPFVALLVSGGHTQLVRVDGSVATRCLGSLSMTPRGKPSTRPPRCWANPTRVAPTLPGWLNRATRSATISRGPWSRSPASISVSAA